MKNQPLTNSQIISEFKKAAAVLTVIDNIPFRVRAYQQAIDTINDLDEELSILKTKTDLTQLQGIGQELAAKINDLTKVGESQDLNELFSKVPQGMFPLLDIPGIGPKKAHRLAETFSLTDQTTAIKQLKKACKEGHVSKIEGFGEKTQTEILSNIEKERPKTNRLRLDQADKIATQIITHLKELSEVKEALPLGSIRRRSETVGDIDIGVSTANPSTVINHLKSMDSNYKLKVQGENVVRILTPDNHQIDVKFSQPSRWGSMLQHFTGSKNHNIALREHGLKQDKSLSEHGIKQNNKLKQFSDEESFYKYLGLANVPPEVRENNGEIEAAAKMNLPKLITHKDIKGDLHTHTDYDWISSHDSGESVHRLLTSAHKLGYQWLALGDHNPATSKYNSKQLIQQIKDRSIWIEQQYYSWKQSVKKSNIVVHKTLEVDISPDGTIAIPQPALDHLDFIIISIHSGFNQSHDAQTKRLLKALCHPKVKLLAHPTARIINRRESIRADWDKIFQYCSSKNIAVEINGSPYRLDLPDSLIRSASKHKIKFALSSDAHRADQLHQNMPYAVSQARRGWLDRDQIINNLDTKQFTRWLQD